MPFRQFKEAARYGLRIYAASRLDDLDTNNLAMADADAWRSVRERFARMASPDEDPERQPDWDGLEAALGGG